MIALPAMILPSISATVCGGYPQTGLRAQACAGRPDLGSSDWINRIHRADVPAVELGRVIEEEVDLIELFLLDVEDGIGE
jgi:hypothetical protein